MEWCWREQGQRGEAVGWIGGGWERREVKGVGKRGQGQSVHHAAGRVAAAGAAAAIACAAIVVAAAAAAAAAVAAANAAAADCVAAAAAAATAAAAPAGAAASAAAAAVSDAATASAAAFHSPPGANNKTQCKQLTKATEYEKQRAPAGRADDGGADQQPDNRAGMDAAERERNGTCAPLPRHHAREHVDDAGGRDRLAQAHQRAAAGGVCGCECVNVLARGGVVVGGRCAGFGFTPA
eukprot:152326-Chlamydomonas_euryale.AAC.1